MMVRILCLALAIGWTSNVWAGTTPNTPNTKNQKSTQTPKKPSPQPKKFPKKLPADRMEFTLLPVLNYSSDRGFGFGAYSIIARFREDVSPYLWRLYFRLSATVKLKEDGEAEFPYHEDFVRLDLPGLVGGRLRLNVRAGFFRFSTTGYYGLGNASQRLIGGNTPSSLVKPSTYYQYDRIYPEAMIMARWRLWRKGRKQLNLFYGGSAVYNVTEVRTGTKLAEDIQASMHQRGERGDFLREQLRGLSPHVRLEGTIGLIWDSRDSEFAPSKGMFHELSVRGGTGFSSSLAYVGINAKAHLFLSLWKEYLVLAVRMIGDVLLGNPPLYELTRFGGIFPNEGPGGGFGVRATVPQRYYGRAKWIGNLELRSKIIQLQIWRLRINLGLVAFFDAGRVWGALSYASDTLRQSVDGEDPGIKYSFGGGGRLQLGSTVVLRADVAYSPSEGGNLGFFFILGHMF